MPTGAIYLQTHNMLNPIIGKLLMTSAACIWLGLLGCQSQDNSQNAQGKIATPSPLAGQPLTSKNGQVRLTSPPGWQQQQLAGPFTLSLTSVSQDAYITLKTLPKENIANLNLDQVAQLNRQASSLTFVDLDAQTTKVEAVNGYPAVQYELRGSTDDVKIVLLLTMVETPDHFYQLLAGTSEFSYKRYQETFQNIIQSFQELESGEAKS